jgi:hypothetical protein
MKRLATATRPGRRDRAGLTRWGKRLASAIRTHPRRRAPSGGQIVDLRDLTTTDASGAVRSTQAADLLLAVEALEEIWTPVQLERLARTYWRFLTRATLGLIRVEYTERERFVVLLAQPVRLLTFQAPEYEMDERRGVVRWRIERGLLVARRGRGGDGYLQIDIQRHDSDRSGRARIHVEVEVANFYPAIASGIGRWFYNETQSRVHVLITHRFLRSLARLDLAESRVGRFAKSIEEVPDPPPAGQRSPREENATAP